MSLTDAPTNGTNGIRPLEERLAETAGLLNGFGRVGAAHRVATVELLSPGP